jgi:hypothetical protein
VVHFALPGIFSTLFIAMVIHESAACVKKAAHKLDILSKSHLIQVETVPSDRLVINLLSAKTTARGHWSLADTHSLLAEQREIFGS